MVCAEHKPPCEGACNDGCSATNGLTDRYTDLGTIGTGSMGEVRRVHDRELGRTVAMKIISKPLLRDARYTARFVAEAQVTSQLQHPGIVPIHEVGRLGDGRWYYTMREIRGETLAVVNRVAHGRKSATGTWDTDDESGWTPRRLIGAFHQVCQAVAHAHSRGVIHRDLKPDNIILGQKGEVLVVDWGLAKVLAQPELPAVGEGSSSDAVSTSWSHSEAQRTRMGAVTGTPAYMAPEQARGETDRIDQRSDVFALGAILYEILVGRPHRHGEVWAVLQEARVGHRVPIRSNGMFGAPDDLVAACERAMDPNPDRRFGSADDLARTVGRWLDGTTQRERGRVFVERARACLQSAADLHAKAEQLKAEGSSLLRDVRAWQPESEKLEAWELQDEAQALRRRARALEIEHEQLLQASLTHAPDLAEAHAALATLYLHAHERAETNGDEDEAIRAVGLLTRHRSALRVDDPTRARVAAYLSDRGALSIATDPPGAEVHLYRYVVEHRRLVPVFDRLLGITPLVDVDLELGSYLCILKKEGHTDVRYPVFLDRRDRNWPGVAPGASDQTPIWLPRNGELAADDCYIPAGWFWSGGDTLAHDATPLRRHWCDGLIAKRDPVTNLAYLSFLDDLVRQGREDEALVYAPRERGGSENAPGRIIYGRRGDGRFILQKDADGDLWDPSWPVTMVDWFCARAFAHWLAARTARGWRLPRALEWEKAARGVDARRFPWGDAFDPSWCHMSESHRGRNLPAPVDGNPVDTSPYGVRGTGGNMRDWCSDPPDGGPGGRADPMQRVVRGGSWLLSAPYCRVATRSTYGARDRSADFGIRLVRSIG